MKVITLEDALQMYAQSSSPEKKTRGMKKIIGEGGGGGGGGGGGEA